MQNIDYIKMVVPNKVSLVKRVFNISLATYVLKKLAFLCIFFSKLSAYRTNFDETKYMSFLMKDDELLEKYNEIWEKLKNSIKRKVDCEPVYNEIYLKGKKKYHNGKINTNFHNNKIPKEGSSIYLFISNFDRFCFETGKNWNPQAFSEKCKYVAKVKKMPKFITNNIQISSDDCDREDSIEENSDKENSDDKNFNEEN